MSDRTVLVSACKGVDCDGCVSCWPIYGVLPPAPPPFAVYGFYDGTDSCPACHRWKQTGTQCAFCPPPGYVVCPATPDTTVMPPHQHQKCALCKRTGFVEELVTA